MNTRYAPCDKTRKMRFSFRADRAAKFGLDVYTFPHFKNTAHPDEGAFAHYDTMYGQLARNCPNIKGYMFVGECCEFPARDPRTASKSWQESKAVPVDSPGQRKCVRISKAPLCKGSCHANSVTEGLSLQNILSYDSISVNRPGNLNLTKEIAA